MPFRSGSRRRDDLGEDTTDGEVQRPWGRGQPDLLWEGGEAGERLSKDRAGVLAAHKAHLYQRPGIGPGDLPPHIGQWALFAPFCR